MLALLAALAAACGPSSGDDGGGTEGSSRCAAAPFDAGLLGITEERICDVGGPEECLRPASGIMVGLYDRDAQIGGDVGGGTLDPEAVELASVVSDSGRFELELSPGSYWACAIQGPDDVTCSGMITIDDATPLHLADYEYGNGSGWTVRACDG